MARNKHPEQTLEKIVETAAQLFVEKGYEYISNRQQQIFNLNIKY